MISHDEPGTGLTRDVEKVKALLSIDEKLDRIIGLLKTMCSNLEPKAVVSAGDYDFMNYVEPIKPKPELPKKRGRKPQVKA